MSASPTAPRPFPPGDLPGLLDERNRPDFRDAYVALTRAARSVAVALTRIRLVAMDLGRNELADVERIRLLLAEMNALTLRAEAEALAADPLRRDRLLFLLRRLEEDRLHVRLRPMGGWAPDFSVFSFPGEAPRTLVVGPHRLERPYPHPGPLFASIHHGAEADRAAGRFEALWAGAHDLRLPLVRTLRSVTEAGRPIAPAGPGGSAEGHAEQGVRGRKAP